MTDQGYQTLISYKLSQIAFDLGWDFVPIYYSKYEDGRQRDQIKQALRSFKQNVTEGSSERSLSTKLKLYDVARSSEAEAREDFEDILRRLRLIRWSKDDLRLRRLRLFFESNSPNPPFPSIPPFPSCSSVLRLFGKEEKELGGKEGQEIIVNYEIDLLIRGGYLLDQQIRAVEEKHKTEGGYNENLFKKRQEFRNG